MVLISAAPPALPTEVVSLYHTTDSLFDAPVLIFHGPSPTTNATLNSSRIQAHVFTPAGFQSYPRLTLSPSSPLHAVVDHLPREKQGDEICRGLGFSLLKYFIEMPEVVKRNLVAHASLRRPGGVAPKMFDEMHAGDIASRLVKIDGPANVIKDIHAALVERTVSWVDVDLILPEGSVGPVRTEEDYADNGQAEEDPSLSRYGKYAGLIKAFGAPAFLPTSKLRRAPSKPTAISRSRSLLKAQKESLRREMCELVDTEERYASKIYDLVNSVAEEFRQKARSRPLGSASPSEQAMQRLFPPSLNKVLEVNTNFLDAIRLILEETENEAIEDIRTDADSGSTGSRLGVASRKRDATGAVRFAKVLLEWFPRFAEPYQEYMRASTEFPQILTNFLRDNASSFSQRVHETGEQRLRSMLIEPVQRLPRYTLFIDSIANLLPATHPSLQIFLKARDIITDICSLDCASSADLSNIVTRLKRIITSWPDYLAPSGRLIAAADFNELSPPYRTDIQVGAEAAGLMLLFKECVVLLRKPPGSKMSARGVLAEVDRPTATVMTGSESNQASPCLNEIKLTFAGYFDLGRIRFSESHNGCMVWISWDESPQGQGNSGHTINTNPISVTGTQAFWLTGAFEGKASKWIEEVVKARVEGRFTETERENDKWGLRSIQHPSESLGLLTAIFEHDLSNVAATQLKPANIKVVVDAPATTSIAALREHGVEIIASIRFLSDDLYRLEVDGLDDYATTDTVTTVNFPSIFNKRIGNLLRMHNQPQNPALTNSIITANRTILKSLRMKAEEVQPQHKSYRPSSPVKMISQFFGGVSLRETGSPTKQRAPLPNLKDVPIMLPPNRAPTRSASQKTANEEQDTSEVTLRGVTASSRHQDPLRLLEETFSTYMLALRSRSGNVVGKLLRGRAWADELAVNELYNILLEDPLKIQAAAEVSVDVLFAAFEKFITGVWKEQIGPVIAAQTLTEIQTKCYTLHLTAFEEYFKTVYGEMAPQNRRAFAAIIRLLADLLDASGSDGDRGALTATFAELLVREGNPHEYITLLDRLVDDSDRLLGYTPPVSSSGESASMNGSMTSRTRSTNTGSLSSNTSSMRKRFGFGTLSRENSKNETESRVGYVWRTLSKTAKATSDVEQQGGNMSKISLMRSKSTDTDARVTVRSRPESRDRPLLQSAFSYGEQLPRPETLRPGSGHKNLSSLSTIGEAPNAVHPRKKRRSSLSDLKSVQDHGVTPSWAPTQPRTPTRVPQPVQHTGSSPRAFSPTKIGVSTSPDRLGSPDRFGSPNRKENSPSMPKNTLTERAVNRLSDEVVITTYSPRKRTNLQSNIPTIKSGLQEKPDLITGTQPAKRAPSSPQKLKMQSPQKLRERLNNEQKALTGVESALNTELRIMSDQLSTLNLLSTTTTNPTPTATTNLTSSPPPTLQALTKRLQTLQTSTLPTALATLTARLTSLQTDLDTTLQAHERKIKALEELYRQANSENELLYGRFNDELARVMAGVHAGKGVEEMRKVLGEREAEISVLRREVGRLRRERFGIRGKSSGSGPAPVPGLSGGVSSEAEDGSRQ